jgi:hypothetical protein
MRNNYQNLARRSLAKTRHNSISKAKRIFVFLDTKKKKKKQKQKPNSSIGRKSLYDLPNQTSSLIMKKYNLRQLGKLLERLNIK